jgi:hypothetical protein
MYLSVYDRRDGVSEHTSSPSPPSSLTHVHRYIDCHNTTRHTLTTSPKLTYLSMSDSRDGVSDHTTSPSPPSSLTHVHRCIGSHNGTRETLSTSVKLTYLSMYDCRFVCWNPQGAPSGAKKKIGRTFRKHLEDFLKDRKEASEGREG